VETPKGECHYEGRCAADYPAGKTFDSSYDRGSPTAFAPNQVIKGWTEAMQLMVEGDKWEMYGTRSTNYFTRGCCLWFSCLLCLLASSEHACDR
jgi:FKBP-type peptidyl-prolyl cis-trans isomerase FklB